MDQKLNKTRCGWLNLKNDQYIAYHDEEWGVPVYDDQTLFEMLILEGAQAGLSWETVLKKREGYREAFKDFDVEILANIDDEYLEEQLKDPKIIRNRLKVFSVRKNAIAFIQIQKEFGSFSKYLWDFVDGKPIVNNPKSTSDVPAKTALSDTIAKDLKKRGMSFVGSTIIYAYMQAAGLINDHTQDCSFRNV